MPLDDHVKVVFRLEQDEDDWPPAGSESLWGEVGDDYRPRAPKTEVH